MDIEKCLGCKNCEIYCMVEHSSSKDLFSAIFETPTPMNRISVEHGDMPFPIMCRHCEDAPCVDACPTGGLKMERGIVSHNTDMCIGCWMCAMVCPFGAIFPMDDRKIALKCDRCPDIEIPACVDACPTEALIFGELSEIMEIKRGKVAGMILSAAKMEIGVGSGV